MDIFWQHGHDGGVGGLIVMVNNDAVYICIFLPSLLIFGRTIRLVLSVAIV